MQRRVCVQVVADELVIFVRCHEFGDTGRTKQDPSDHTTTGARPHCHRPEVVHGSRNGFLRHGGKRRLVDVVAAQFVVEVVLNPVVDFYGRRILQSSGPSRSLDRPALTFPPLRRLPVEVW
jgi:hypothetical protein